MTAPAPSYTPQQMTDMEGTWNGVAGQITLSTPFQHSYGIGASPACTLEFWAWVQSGQVVQVMGCSNIIQVDTNGVSVRCSASVTATDRPIQDPLWGVDGWAHFAVVVQNTDGGAQVNVYVNEQLVDSHTTTFPLGMPGIIGYTLNGAGKYADVRFWSTARTPAELYANRSRRLDDALPEGLVGYFPLSGPDPRATVPSVMYDVVSGALNMWTGTWSSTTTSDLVDIFRSWLDLASTPLVNWLLSNKANASLYGAATVVKALGVGATTTGDVISSVYGVRWDASQLESALTAAGFNSTQVSQAVQMITGQSTDVATADLILRAAQDPTFLQQLLSNPVGTLENDGISVPAGTTIEVHVNALNTMHISVEIAPIDPAYALYDLPQRPTPYQIGLWIVTNVQAGGTLAQELLSDPTTVLRQMGVNVPAGAQFFTWQNTQTVRHLVVPYIIDGETAPTMDLRMRRSTTIFGTSTSNVNVNASVNVNAAVDAVAAVNVAVVANVEVATQVAAALVAAEVVAVIVI